MSDEQQRVYQLYKQEEARLAALRMAANEEWHATLRTVFLTWWLPAILAVWSLLVVLNVWHHVCAYFPFAGLTVVGIWIYAFCAVDDALEADAPPIPVWSKTTCIAVVAFDMLCVWRSPDDYIAFHAITAWAGFKAFGRLLAAINPLNFLM